MSGGNAPVVPGSWETFHGFGRWALDTDRRTIYAERSTIRSSCAEHRIVVADDSANPWLLRFESRITAEDCPAAGCVDCSLQLSLARAVPPDVEVRAVCDPDSSIFATTVPGGAQVTLRQPPDGSEPVVCSPVPGPIEMLTSTTAQPPREHAGAGLCTEPPSDTVAASGPLRVEPATVSPGGRLRFFWDVAGRDSYTVGDEMVVWCWDGTDWIPVWVTYSVFTDPVSVLITPVGDDLTITDDGFQESAGTIVVPIEAVPGIYRVAETISFDISDGQSERETGEVFFTVTR